jgi:hypothetical protein
MVMLCAYNTTQVDQILRVHQKLLEESTYVDILYLSLTVLQLEVFKFDDFIRVQIKCICLS